MEILAFNELSELKKKSEKQHLETISKTLKLSALGVFKSVWPGVKGLILASYEMISCWLFIMNCMKR